MTALRSLDPGIVIVGKPKERLSCHRNELGLHDWRPVFMCWRGDILLCKECFSIELAKWMKDAPVLEPLPA